MYTFHDVMVVTNRKLCKQELTKQVAKLTKLNPQGIILREKDLSEDQYEKLSIEILEICRQGNVTCILHYYPEVAKRLHCKNIHLPLHKLREIKCDSSDFTIIGASVHSREEAREAEQLGATYLMAGHVFETDCKKGVTPRGLEFLREICQNVTIPVYAIGGIKESNAEQVMACGAKGICMMSTVMELT